MVSLPNRSSENKASPSKPSIFMKLLGKVFTAHSWVHFLKGSSFDHSFHYANIGIINSAEYQELVSICFGKMIQKSQFMHLLLRPFLIDMPYSSLLKLRLFFQPQYFPMYNNLVTGKSPIIEKQKVEERQLKVKLIIFLQIVTMICELRKQFLFVLTVYFGYQREVDRSYLITPYCYKIENLE